MCPLSLICYMDYFDRQHRMVNDRYKGSYIFLCSSCGKLIYVIINEGALLSSINRKVYTFFCEKRNVADVMKNHINNSKYNSIFSSIITDDPVTAQNLQIIKCAKCATSNEQTPLRIQPGVDWIDLE